MADEGSSLFCDEDESCEKNISESDEDGEEYVSAPIGKIAKAFRCRFCLSEQSLREYINLACCFPPALHRLCCTFHITHRFIAKLYRFSTRSFDLQLCNLLFLLSRQAWASRKMASAQTSQFYSHRHPASSRPSGKI